MLIPVQCEYLALGRDLPSCTDTLDRVRQALNPTLEIEGVVMTMYDERTNLSRQVVDEVRSVFGESGLQDGRAPEHPARGSAKPRQADLPVRHPVPRGRGYLNLAKEFVEHEKKGAGQGA
mgnify:CR=1 FL=1